MTRHAGRGHPRFTPAQRARYLELVTQGLSLDEAAARVGVSRRTVNKHAATDPVFRQAREKAKEEGRRARWASKPHGEYRYIHGGCRCSECRAAASAARAARRQTAARGGVGGSSPEEPAAGPGADPTSPTVISLPTRDTGSDLPVRSLAAVS